MRLSKNLVSSTSLAIIGAAIVLVIAGTAYFVQQERQRTAINEQIAQTNKLIDQLKVIGNENKALNRQNRDFAYCNAVLLAKYTQDQSPIVIEDLNKCVLTSFPKDEGVDPILQDNATVFLGSPNPTLTVERMLPSGEVAEFDEPVTFPEATTPPPANTNQNNSQNSAPLAEVPGVLKLELPCVSVGRLVKTCQ